MAREVEFIKDSVVNKQKYKTGQKLNVSTSIFNRLIEAGEAKETEASKKALKEQQEKPKTEQKKAEEK